MPKWHPKYWSVYPLLWVLWLLAHLPYQIRRKLGGAFGLLYYSLARKDKRIALINLQLCFPTLSLKARKSICRESFKHLTTTALESIFMSASHRIPLDKMLASIEGFEHVETAKQQGKGVIILFPHLTPIFFAGYLCWRTLDTHFGFMYRTSRHPVIARQFAKQFKGEAQAFTRRDAKKMIDFLRNGGVVWYAPDLLPRRQDRVFVPFLGVNAATGVAPMRFASITGARVLTVGLKRDKQGRFHIRFQAPIEHFPSDDVASDAAKINAAMAEHITAYPEAYLWLYKRFNQQPPGVPNPYQ